ncbi:MAG: hypothetical protein GF317_13985 [Candidatus Lokiarchaeota archaeon]|nr:hypothetical protein [Candidatus Lokiarchaeota archaeon]MBD3200726.1 hypothetical protein [Candidatus Lokiarchaeota archaeon]
MINNHDKEEIEIEALSLIDRAENLADEGKGKEAIDLYEKAAQKYLDIGSYIKLDQLFIKISSIISKFKNNIQAVYRLKSIIRKTEELDLKEISAKLLIQLGNLSFKMKDYETAGNAWSKASDYFYELDSEEYYKLSSQLLLKAGEALERTKHGADKGEHLILKAVMTVNKFDEIYQMEEKRALKLLNMEDYEAASNKFIEISKYFRKAVKHLEEIMEDNDQIGLMKNSKSRLIHLIAEYELVAALSLRASEDRKYNDKIKELGNSVINLLKKSIKLLKEAFNAKSADIDKEDILRITFDMMLLTIVRGMLGKRASKDFEPKTYLKDGVSNKKLIKKMKDSPFYKLAERIDKIGIRETLDKLQEAHLGHLNKVKEMLIPYFS